MPGRQYEASLGHVASDSFRTPWTRRSPPTAAVGAPGYSRMKRFPSVAREHEGLPRHGLPQPSPTSNNTTENPEQSARIADPLDMQNPGQTNQGARRIWSRKKKCASQTHREPAFNASGPPLSSARSASVHGDIRSDRARLFRLRTAPADSEQAPRPASEERGGWYAFTWTPPK